MRDLHSSWDRAVDVTTAVGKAIGHTVVDAENGTRWDTGQAICREMFGADWINHPDFAELNASEICPQSYFDAADRLISREATWVRYPTDK